MITRVQWTFIKYEMLLDWNATTQIDRNHQNPSIYLENRIYIQSESEWYILKSGMIGII